MKGEEGKGNNGMMKMNKSSFNDKLFRIKLNGLENEGVRMSKWCIWRFFGLFKLYDNNIISNDIIYQKNEDITADTIFPLDSTHSLIQRNI